VDTLRRLSYRRYEGEAGRPVEEDVIAEASVVLAVNGAPWLSFLCTPRDLEAFAAGFLFNEGLIASADEIGSVAVCGRGDLVDVWLTRPVERPSLWQRTSGCTGGVTSNPADATAAAITPVEDGGLALRPADVTRLVSQLFESQDLYLSAGGVHTSALSDGETILFSVEDVGRHNTFDKIVGRCLLGGVAPRRRVLLTTGRVSSEMLQKAARFGAAMVISRTSPTSLAVELAERWGITLIGYARLDRFDVYAGGRRILDGRRAGGD
jgi:FdhD protein